MIAELCKQLLQELQKSKAPGLSYLQAGISEDEANKNLQIAGLDISLPRYVYDLYACQNGINEESVESVDIGELSFFKLGIFMSLNFSIAAYLEQAVENSYWPKNLFPLFESGVGDYYLIDSDKRSDTYQMIMYYSPANPYFQGTVSIFDSLETCLTTIIECYRAKAYYFDPETRYLSINGKLEMEIWRKHNPNSEYYKILDEFSS